MPSPLVPVGCNGTRSAVDRDGKTVADESVRLDLQTFQRAVHVTHRAAAPGFFTEHMPRFERSAKLELNVALLQIANTRETKFEVWRKPIELEGITGFLQIADDVAEIRFAKMR